MQPPLCPDARQALCGYPIDFVLIPRHEPRQATALRPIPRSQAMKELVEQSLDLRLWGPSGLELLARVVREAQCYSLISNDLQEAVAVVERLTR